jgi:hypothetical protein
MRLAARSRRTNVYLKKGPFVLGFLLDLMVPAGAGDKHGQPATIRESTDFVTVGPRDILPDAVVTLAGAREVDQ